jgi:hypothetical protein
MPSLVYQLLVSLPVLASSSLPKASLSIESNVLIAEGDWEAGSLVIIHSKNITPVPKTRSHLVPGPLRVVLWRKTKSGREKRSGK